eukprot:403357620
MIPKHTRTSSGLQIKPKQQKQDPILSQRKRVFCGEHLEEVVHIQQNSAHQVTRQYCKECLQIDHTTFNIDEGGQQSTQQLESIFHRNLEMSQQLLIQSNLAIKQYASVYSKASRLLNQSVKDVIQEAKHSVISMLEDYFDQNNCQNIKDRMYSEKLKQLDDLKNQYQTIVKNLTNINEQALLNYRHLQEDLCWHISTLLNQSPVKRQEQLLQNMSYSDDETEHAKKLVNNLNTYNQLGSRGGQFKSNHSNFNIMDSFRANQSIEYSEHNNSLLQGSEGGAGTFENLIYKQSQSIQSLEQGNNEESEEDSLAEETNFQKEAFTHYLDEQLEKIHKMQNKQYTNGLSNNQQDFNVAMHNNEIQRLKDVVEREEENCKQRLLKLKKQKEEEDEKFKTVTNVRYQLQNMLKKDLYFIKGESSEIFIYDLNSSKFKVQKFENFTSKFPKNFSSVQMLNRDIFLFGGVYQQSKYSQKTLQIKLSSTKYKQQICEKSQMISPKINIPICLIKNRYAYLCGGFYNKMLTDCDIYSIEEDRWFEGPKLNYPRANCALCPFDDRFIYIFCDAGLHGSSNLMKSIDEDLSLSLDYKWEVIEVKDQKEFIANIHFNGVIQISPKDILIFGGQNRQSFRFEIDSKKNKESMIKMDSKFNVRQMSKFVYEKDFQAIVQQNQLFAIDPNYKTVHILEINKLLEESQNIDKYLPKPGQTEEDKVVGVGEENKKQPTMWMSNLRLKQMHQLSPGPSKSKMMPSKKVLVKKSFQEFSQAAATINLNNSSHTEANNTLWEIKTFKEIGINIANVVYFTLNKMSFKYNNFMGGLGLTTQQEQYESRTSGNNQLIPYASNNSASNKQFNQPLFNIKEGRASSRGSHQNFKQQDSLFGQNKQHNGAMTVGNALMNFRNQRGRSIQSAGKPPIGSYPGQLPTLGLNRYKNVDIKNGENSKNPFSIQSQTEKLLIARERERENRDMNRMHSDGLRVFQKTIQNRQNRAGVIREINDIKPTKNGKTDQLMLMNASYEDQQQIQQQNKKLNIFDENDSSIIKHETLAKLGFEAKGALISAVDEESETRSIRSHTSSMNQGALQKPRALEYLQKGRDQKESTRDFILNARNILTAQIAINDKTEETERLKEYIIMEKEKLEEAKKTFDEDRDKFQKYMEDLNRKAEETATDIKIQKKKSKIKQIDEKLVVYKQHKAFLDLLAISAGKKQDRRAHSLGESIGNSGGIAGGARKDSRPESQTKASRLSKKEGGPGFFLTQANQNGQKHKNSLDKQDDLDQEAQMFEEDEDFQIYFDKFTLLEHLSHLEEDNLFKIHLVQEDEQALDKLRRAIDLKIKQKEQEIEDVGNNIEMLISSKNQLQTKQSFLDTNMRVKQTSSSAQHAHNSVQGGSVIGHSSTIRQPNHDNSRLINQSHDQTLGGNEGSEKTNAMSMLQSLTGCSKDNINKLNSLISIILEKAGIKQDDQTDKIEMLRKIEQKLNYLAEAKDYIANGNKKKDLDVKEKELHIMRKEQNIQKTKMREQLIQEERQRKNRERIRKQENFKIFKGRKDMHRARKADLKPKEKTDDTPNQEVIDQIRYLGGKLVDEDQQPVK